MRQKPEMFRFEIERDEFMKNSNKNNSNLHEVLENIDTNISVNNSYKVLIENKTS